MKKPLVITLIILASYGCAGQTRTLKAPQKSIAKKRKRLSVIDHDLHREALANGVSRMASVKFQHIINQRIVRNEKICLTSLRQNLGPNRYIPSSLLKMCRTVGLRAKSTLTHYIRYYWEMQCSFPSIPLVKRAIKRDLMVHPNKIAMKILLGRYAKDRKCKSRSQEM